MTLIPHFTSVQLRTYRDINDIQLTTCSMITDFFFSLLCIWDMYVEGFTIKTKILPMGSNMSFPVLIASASITRTRLLRADTISIQKNRFYKYLFILVFGDITFAHRWRTTYPHFTRDDSQSKTNILIVLGDRWPFHPPNPSWGLSPHGTMYYRTLNKWASSYSDFIFRILLILFMIMKCFACYAYLLCYDHRKFPK